MQGAKGDPHMRTTNSEARDMQEAFGVCETMMRCFESGARELKVHSVFDRAMNFSSECGMVTLLSPDRCLMPFSVLLRTTADFRALAYGHAFRMDADGITVDGRPEIGFRSAERVDLHLPRTALSGVCSGSSALDALRSFLGRHTDRGLTELAFGGRQSVYARFLAPRLERLRQVAKESDESLIAAAYDVAGCGEGLTPSSDDLLCGYLLCASFVRERDTVRKAAYRAAERTNDISASLLRRAGDGLFSRDVLSLIDCLNKGEPAEETQTAIARVAAFGSSSGCDFLTGLYFGILDFIK